MPQIIPAILAQDETAFRQKLEILRPLNALIHIDVMDGVFVPQITFNDLSKLKEILLDQSLAGQGFEAHLMVEHPLAVLEGWLGAGAKRVLFHLESQDDPLQVIQMVKKYQREIVIVLNPETPWQKIEPYIKDLDLVMFMGVQPGKSGQEFNPDVLKKISAFHQKYPAVPIEVDGGVTLENASILVQAGATYLATASALFKGGEIEMNFKKFKDQI